MPTTIRNRSHFNQQRKSQKHRRQVRRRRLLLEPLETRVLLAIIWNADGDTAAWSDANNWDLNRVPMADDDVVIPDLAATSQVTFDASAGIRS